MVERSVGLILIENIDPNAVDQGRASEKRLSRCLPNGQWGHRETTRWQTMSSSRRDFGFGSLTIALEVFSPSIASRNDTNGDCHKSARKILKNPIWLKIPEETVEELIVLACRAPLFNNSNPPLQVSSVDK